MSNKANQKAQTVLLLALLLPALLLPVLLLPALPRPAHAKPRPAPIVALRPGPQGFITFWLLHGPAAVLPAGWPEGPATPPGSGAEHGVAWRWVAQAGSVLRLPRRLLAPASGRERDPVYLRTRFTVPTARRGFALLGARGSARVWLDGERLADVPPGPGRVLADDLPVPVSLSAGEHCLEVQLDWAAGERGLALRFVGEGFDPWTDLVVQPRAAELLDASAPPLPDPLPALAALALGEVRPSAVGFALPVLVVPGMRFEAPAAPPVAVLAITVRHQPADGGPEQGWTLPAERVPLPLPSGPLRGWGDAHTSGLHLERSVALPATAGRLRLTLELQTTDGRSIARLERSLPCHPRDHRALDEAQLLLHEAASRGGPPEPRWAVEAWLDEARALIASGSQDRDYLEPLLERSLAAAGELARGRDPLAGKTGVLLRAYRSPLDGSLQPYALYVPRAYDGRTRYPLVVGLHGMGSTPRICLRQLFGLDPPPEEPAAHAERFLPELPDIPALVVCPNGHGNAGFRFPGEHDVLRVITEVSRLYRVDPQRVTLAGMSMGGIGTFALATRYPDRFAAAAALAGMADVRLYNEIRGWPLHPWEPWFIARQSPVDWAENGVNLPFRIIHGTRDATPVRQSEVFADRYRELRYPVELETPALGHNVWGTACANGELLKWLRKHARPRRPDRVVLTTADYRHRHADWLTIDRLAPPPAGMARLAGTVGGRQGRTVRLQASGGVQAFTLHLDDPGFPRRGTMTVELDGQKVAVPAGRPAHLVRVRQEGPDGQQVWASADRPPLLAGRKRPGLSGPLDDARYEPLLFVYGTQDPQQTEVNRLRAEEDARSLWGVPMRYPVKADAEVTAEDREQHHLVLYGNPQSNRELARVADRLPIRFTAGAIEVGGRRYPGEDTGVAFIYPDPERPDHYLVVFAGTTWQGTLLSHHLPRYLPDYVVFDRRIAGRRHLRIFQGRPVLEGGFFDESWQPPADPVTPAR